MPFAKGNTLWKEGVKAKQENKTRLQMFFSGLAGGALTEYANKLDRLGRKADEEGEDALTANEREFMDRFEGWREFIAPKLTRTESKITTEVELKIASVDNIYKKSLKNDNGREIDIDPQESAQEPS